MVDYSWFKLFVRALGVIFIGLGGPTVIGAIATMAAQLEYFRSQPSGGGPSLWMYLTMMGGSALGSLLQLLFGLYLLLGGSRLIDLCLRGVLGHCAACGYDVHDITGATCPECGVLLPGRSPVPPRQAPAAGPAPAPVPAE